MSIKYLPLIYAQSSRLPSNPLINKKGLGGVELFNAENFVFLVEEDYRGLECFQLAVFNIAVTENDNPVSNNTFPCGRTIQTDLSSFTRNNIGFKPLPVVEVAHHNLFIWKYSCLFQNLFIKCETPLIGKVRLRDRCHMYLCPKYAS
jgi:hypothetical protein